MVQHLRSKDTFHDEMNIPDIFKYLENSLHANIPELDAFYIF